MGRLKWLWATSAEADCEFAVYLISGSFHGMSSCHFSSMSAQESHTLYTEAQSFNNDRSNIGGFGAAGKTAREDQIQHHNLMGRRLKGK